MKNVVKIALFFCAILVSAQNKDTLSSDRPGQALSSNTVGENVFQIQAGIDFLNSSSDFYPNSFFRYGISERFELNSGFILSGHKFGNDLESFTIGARYLLNKNNSKYTSSLQFSFDAGAATKNSQITYIIGSSLSEKLSYTINLGLNFNNNFALNNGIYVFNLSYALNEHVGLFIEPFGKFLKSNFKFNFDSGVYYLLNNNLQLDALIGNNDGVFLGAGVTWRVPF